MNQILTELGWNSFQIPIANEENKKFEQMVENEGKLKATLLTKLEFKEELLQVIKTNIRHIESQQDHNQILIRAHSTQITAENNLYKTSQSVSCSLNQEMQQFEKDKKEAAERIFRMKKDMTKANEKLKVLESNIKLDQTRLLQWEKTLQNEGEDNELIQQFIQSDTKQFKEYELKRQKLEDELEAYKTGIVKAVDKISEVEIVLNQIAKMYVQALNERRQLIDQWTQSALVLRQRDNAIEEVRMEIEALREIARGKMQIFQDSEEFQKNQISNNKELEDNIEQLEKKIIHSRKDQRKFVELLETHETEKKSLEEYARLSQNERASIRSKKIEIENKCIKAKDFYKQIDDLKVILRDIGNQKINIEERIRQLEEMLEKEERGKSVRRKEMSRFQTLILRAVNQICELENGIKIICLRRQNERKKTETLEIFRAKIEKLFLVKKNDLYNIEIEAQKCEMRFQRLSDVEKDRHELARKQQTLENLQKTHKERIEIFKLLKTQIDHLEHDFRQTTQSLVKNIEELERFRSKKQELMLLTEVGEKQLKLIHTSNEEEQVKENLLRLKVNQAEKLLSSNNGKMYNLGKHRLQIEASMQERIAEIKAQKEILSIQKRVALNECSELRSMILERRTRIHQLKSRYDTNNALAGINSHDGTYLKVQTTQEKYLLQEQGDELDQTIRKMEQEIESMENTLRIVKTCNDKYKSSLTSVDENGPEKVEQKKLIEELCNVLRRKRQKRAQFDEKEEDLMKMENNYLALMEDIERIKEEKEHKKRCVENLERQITEQREKLLRAEKSLGKIFKDIQNMCSCTDDETILWQEKDILVRELQELNNIVLQHIVEFTIRHVEAEAYVKKLLTLKNIKLPCIYYMKPSSSSSRRDSLTTSSVDVKFQWESRVSSLRENIGCIVNLEPQFSNASNMEKLIKTKCKMLHKTDFKK